MSIGTGAVSRRKTGVIAALSMMLLAASVGACTGLKASSSGPAKPAARTQALTHAAPAIDQARVTGYASSPIVGRPSGPVTVMVHGASAARLYRLVEGLRVAKGFPCVENVQMYQITFTSVAATIDVTGYECGGAVDVTSRGTFANRTDRGCTLLSAVRRLLPATATATQRLVAPCQLPTR